MPIKEDPAPNGEGAGGQSLPMVAAAAVAFIAGVGGLTLTGTLGRVQRNAGVWFAVSIGMVLLGAALWLLGTIVDATVAGMSKAEAKRRAGLRTALHIGGVAITVAGLATGFVATVLTANDTEQPAVSLKAGPGGTSVVATASVNNLSSDERLTVTVDGLKQDAPDNFVTPRGGSLYRAYVGPDADGKATHEITVSVPPGRYDAAGIRAWVSTQPAGCGYVGKKGSGEDGTGCAILRLPAPRAEHPQLTASWEGKDRTAASLKLTVESTDAASSQFTALHVVGLKRSKLTTLYKTLMAPPATGALKREIRVPVDGGIKTVCARAEFVIREFPARGADCPVSDAATGAVIELHVPATAKAKP